MTHDSNRIHVQLPRKRGRPPKSPPWLREAAQLVGRGISLRKALWRLGVQFTEAELRGTYRLVNFRRWMDEARIEYYREFGNVPRRTRARPIDSPRAQAILGDIMGRVLHE